MGSPQKKKPTTTARSQRFLTDWTHNVLYDVFAQEFWIIYRHLQSNALATKSPRHPNCSTPHMTSKCHKWQTTILSRNAAFLPLQNMEGVFARWRVKCCHTRRQFFVAIPFRRNWRITGASTIYGNFTCITQFLKKNHWNTIVDQRMADALIVRTCSTACSGYVGAIKKSDCCFHPWCHHRRQNNISTEFPAWMIWLKFALLWGDAAKR